MKNFGKIFFILLIYTLILSCNRDNYSNFKYDFLSEIKVELYYPSDMTKLSENEIKELLISLGKYNYYPICIYSNKQDSMYFEVFVKKDNCPNANFYELMDNYKEKIIQSNIYAQILTFEKINFNDSLEQIIEYTHSNSNKIITTYHLEYYVLCENKIFAFCYRRYSHHYNDSIRNNAWKTIESINFLK